jgi:UDP-glucose 4-epimerase
VRLLVVGATSYIGAAFTAFARGRGATVRAIGSRDCDFRDRAQVMRVFASLDDGAWRVVFFSVVNKSVRNSYDDYLENVAMVRHLVEAMARHPVAGLVYFSSADVYGRRPPVPIDEDSPIAPDTWYGLAKYCGEWMLREPGAVACPVTILRIPGVYGAGPRDPSVIGRMVAGIRGDGRIVVRGDGTALRDYVHVDDVCRVVDALLARGHAGVLNVATGQSVPVIEVALTVGASLEVSFEIVHEPAERTREFDLVFDTSRLRATLPGFKFRTLDEGVRGYL